MLDRCGHLEICTNLYGLVKTSKTYHTQTIFHSDFSKMRREGENLILGLEIT